MDIRDLMDKGIKLELPQLPRESFIKRDFDRSFEVMRSVDNAMRQKAALQEKEREEEKEWRQSMLDEAVRTNESLTEINSSLQTKLDSVNETLDFILNSIGANAQRLERQQILANRELHELAMLIESKDQDGIKQYLVEHGLEAVGTLLTLLQFYIK